MATTITNSKIQWGPVSYFKLKSSTDNAALDIGAMVEGVTIFYSQEMIEVQHLESMQLE